MPVFFPSRHFRVRRLHRTGMRKARAHSTAGFFARLPAVGLAVVLAAGALSNAQTVPVAAPDSSPIIHFLSQTIDWYRRTAVEQQMANELTGVMVVNNDRELSDRIVRLAFDFAKAQADYADKQAGGQNPSQEAGTSRYQALARLSTQLDTEIQQNKDEVAALRQKLETATGQKRLDAQSLIAETESEIELDTARRDAVHTMSQFVAGANNGGSGATGLRAEIDVLARSLPAELTRSTVGSQKNSAAANQAAAIPLASFAPKPQTSGLWGLTTDLLALSRKTSALSDLINRTAALEQTAMALRAPLVNQAKGLAGQGDAIARATSQDNDPAVLAQQKKQLDGLTAQFKFLSSAIVPLVEQGILLDLYQRNLSNWRSTAKSEYDAELKTLLVHLAVLAIILIAVFAGGEIVRKAIYRYVRDVHRRYQFLLMRKIVIACVIVTIILFSFAEQLGSVATFAGLLTAGLALALQSVIVSIAGYFFLIGRFGIGVGDRVQISGVTGEVVEVGLVRLHLMELTPGGSPTGRVVAFANSVVFQSTAGLFKQIPGTSFAWHEVTITLAPDSDYLLVEKRLAPVIERIYEQYRAEMEQQYREMERTLAPVPKNAMKPKTRLRFTPSGLEVVLWFPVGIHNGAEIDDLVTRELLKEIHADPELTLTASGPAIKLATVVPGPVPSS